MNNLGIVKQPQLIALLQRIESRAQNGLIVVVAYGQERALYFQEGRLTSIGHRRYIPLRERLIQDRVITWEQFQAIWPVSNTGVTSEPRSELKLALALIQRQQISHTSLNAWLMQEALKFLEEILTWPESEVSFGAETPTPPDYISLRYYVTSLMASLRDRGVAALQFTSALSLSPTLSLHTQPGYLSPDSIEKRNIVTPPPRTPTSFLQDISARSLSLGGTIIGRLTSLPLKILKRDPHPERFATLSLTLIQGITHPQEMRNARLRITGTFFILLSLLYIPWLIVNLNTSALWFSLTFLLATLWMSLLLFISIYNNWNRSTPQLFPIAQGLEPAVAVLIPTYGEPIPMVQKTLESVLHQDWPHEALVIIVGDDGHKPQMQMMAGQMQKAYPLARIIYHQPPPKDHPERKGKAKDGNLNSMLAYISKHYPSIQYIETRDADDLVGDQNFLRYTIGHLISNTQASYVQTIKEAVVSPGDPFGNLQPVFYRGIMLSKHASNAVFPCGSGLVWRKQHLDKINGFPTWNLVEDLYSGYVALQNGLKGSYLQIVGAIGQTAPEDILNVYKQLGTWALDTVRLFIWKNPWAVKGLTFKQKMHFTEIGLYYLSSFINLLFILMPVTCLFTGYHPFTKQNDLLFLAFLVLYTVVLDLFLLFLGHTVTMREIWRAKQLNIGMMFVYMKACLLAVLYGEHKKPVYKVTRKVAIAGFYFKEVLFQIILFTVLLLAIIYNIWLHAGIVQKIDVGSAIWAVFYLVVLGGMISKSWYGIKLTWPVRR